MTKRHLVSTGAVTLLGVGGTLGILAYEPFDTELNLISGSTVAAFTIYGVYRNMRNYHQERREDELNPPRPPRRSTIPRNETTTTTGTDRRGRPYKRVVRKKY
jgi:hypothetical protein